MHIAQQGIPSHSDLSVSKPLNSSLWYRQLVRKYDSWPLTTVREIQNAPKNLTTPKIVIVGSIGMLIHLVILQPEWNEAASSFGIADFEIKEVAANMVS